MVVVYFQIFFIAAITISFWIGRYLRARGVSRWRVLPATFVTLGILWTLTQVFMPPLMIVQLGFILGTTHLNVRSMRNAEDRRKLQQIIEDVKAELDTERVRALEMVPRDHQRLLSTKKDHDQAFDEAIATAQSTLCVTSGWINDRAMHRRRVAAIIEATGRGVHVFIVFGYRSGDDEPTLTADARRVVAELHTHALDTRTGQKGKLILAHQPVHSKVVVRDNEQAIIGSNNWLSNSAFRNEERSAVIDNTAFATLLRDDVMRMAMQAEADTIPRLLGTATGL